MSKRAEHVKALVEEAMMRLPEDWEDYANMAGIGVKGALASIGHATGTALHATGGGMVNLSKHAHEHPAIAGAAALGGAYGMHKWRKHRKNAVGSDYYDYD